MCYVFITCYIPITVGTAGYFHIYINYINKHTDSRLFMCACATVCVCGHKHYDNDNLISVCDYSNDVSTQMHWSLIRRICPRGRAGGLVSKT